MNALQEFEIVTDKLRHASFCGFKGYRVDKILTIPTQEVLRGAFRISFLQLIKSLLGDLFVEKYHCSFESIRNAKVVLYYSPGHAMREDYVRFMETVASCSNDTVLFTGQCQNGRILSNLRLRISSVKMAVLLLTWMATFCKVGIKTKYWNKFLSALLSSYKWKSLLIKNQDSVLSIKCMVSIFDAREQENVFAQYLRLHNISTATLQHGHYVSEYYNDENDFDIGIGYRGFVSDYFLAWGNSSYNNAIRCGIPESKVIKVGCPSLINPIKIEGSKGAIGILFDGGEETIPDNKNMYNIVHEFAKGQGKVLKVKLHPSFKTPEYTSFIEDENVELYTGNLETFAADVELAICCNTSCLISLLFWGHPLLHYAPVYMYDMYSELKQYSFSTTKELYDLYEKSIPLDKMLSVYTEVGDVKENYRKVFGRLITKSIE